MNTLQFETLALSFFPIEVLDYLNDGTQFGFNNKIQKDIKKIGYSINLTKEVIEQAKNLEIDLIITHHNIWEDHFEMRDDCLALLKQGQIIHFFNHLPLDSMPFGTSHTLMKELGLQKLYDFCRMDQLSFGIIGEFVSPISLKALKNKLEAILTHKVFIWENNKKLIKRIGFVAGSGSDLEALHEAHEYGCDAYITGEKKLKTLLYAKHVGMNFLLGSHTYTELPGLKSYVSLIQKEINCQIIPLIEDYIEIGE